MPNEFKAKNGLIVADGDIIFSPLTTAGIVSNTSNGTINTSALGQGLTFSSNTLSLATQMSIATDSSGLKLSGDSANPGNNTYYGTNSSGIKGWYVSYLGTVTSVSVNSANGFAGSVSTSTTTPVITISTTVNGLLKGNGTSVSAAVAGTDYLTPSSSLAWANITGTPTTLTGYGITTSDSLLLNKQDYLFGYYNYNNGYLIQTNIPTTTNIMIELYIQGNSYGANQPIFTNLQVYNYQTGGAHLTQQAAIAFGASNPIDIFYYNGFVCFWTSQTTSFQTLRFTLRTSIGTGTETDYKISSIQNLAEPTTGVTGLITVTPLKGWNAGNDGSGSGLDADLLDGQNSNYYYNQSMGSANYLARFTGTGLVNSLVQDDGSNVAIGTTPNSGYKLFVSNTVAGKVAVQGFNYSGGGGTGVHGYSYPTDAGTATIYGVQGIATNGTGGRASGTNIGGYFTANGTGTNNYAIIADGGNSGFGVTTPVEKVDVSGNIQLTGNLIPTTNNLKIITSTVNGFTGLQILPNGTGTLSLVTTYNTNDSTNAGYLTFNSSGQISVGKNGTGTTPDMTFNANGTAAMTLFQSGAVVNTLTLKSGIVGIGTNNPAYGKLQVNATALGSNDLFSLTTIDGTYNPRVIVSHVTSTTSQYLKFDSTYSNGTGYANWVFNSGNIGIAGVTSPVATIDSAGVSYKLSAYEFTKFFSVPFLGDVANQKVDFYLTGTQQINGVIKVSVVDSYSGINATGIVQKTFYVGLNPAGSIFQYESRYTDVSDNTANSYAISEITWDSTNSRYKFTLAHQVTNHNQPTVKIEILSEGVPSITNFATITMGSVYTTDVTVYNKPYIYFNQNVGIGTNNPILRLQLNGTEGLPKSTGTSQVGALRVQTAGGNNVLDFGVYAATGTAWLQAADSTNLATSRNLILNPNGGYVGIGTTSPENTLNVIGTLQIGTNTGSYWTKLDSDWLRFNRAGSLSYISQDGIGGSLNFMVSKTTIADTNAMTILSNGNVGIGANPTSTLHLYNGSQTLQFLTGTNSSGYTVQVGLNDDGVNIYNSSTVRGYNFKNGNGNLLLVSSGGNVTITGSTTASSFIKSGGTSSQFLKADGSVDSNTYSTLSTYKDYRDLRTIHPNDIPVYDLQFGFTTMNNNSSGSYADYIHFGGYGDSSGGSQNLVMFNKAAIGMRIYQATSQSATAYSTYMDAVLQDSTGAITLSNGKTVASTESKAQYMPDYVASRGQNLISNATGQLKNNYNFSPFTFDGSQAYYATGSFTTSSTLNPVYNDELIPVDITRRYVLSAWAKVASGVTAHHYLGFAMFDADGLSMSAVNYMYWANTLTTLSADLNNGDTVVHLTDLSNWNVSTGSATYIRGFIFWNYVNSFGYAYGPETYSRNIWSNLWTDANVDKVNNTITLSSPWANGKITAGTSVSQSYAGASFKYITIGGIALNTTWTKYTGYVDGLDLTGQNTANKFEPGTAYIKILFITNYPSTGTAGQIWFSNLYFGLDYMTTTELTANYLPLSAGSSSPLTGSLYLTPVSAGNTYIVLNGDNTLTGALVIQAGRGSQSYGGGVIMYSGSHASKAGWVTAGLSNSTSKFSVNNQGLGAGTEVFTVDAVGNVTANSGFIKSGGTASQFLKANGSVDSTVYAPSANTMIYQTSLGSGVDLNTLTTTGWWQQGSNANAAAGTNYPAPYAGKLEVYNGTSMIYQTYQVYPNSNVTEQIWYRCYYGAWSSWKQIVNTLGNGASGTWGISVTGNAATVTNGLYSTGSYADPSWLTSLSWSKITSTPITLAGYGIQGSGSGTYEVSITNAGTNATGLKTRLKFPVFNGAPGLTIESWGNSTDGYNGFIYTGQTSSELRLSAGNGSRAADFKIAYDGTLVASVVNDAAGDFLTRNSSTGVITRRTASEALSDLGAYSPTNYQPGWELIGSGADTNTASSVYYRIGSVSGSNWHIKIYLTGTTTSGTPTKTTIYINCDNDIVTAENRDTYYSSNYQLYHFYVDKDNTSGVYYLRVYTVGGTTHSVNWSIYRSTSVYDNTATITVNSNYVADGTGYTNKLTLLYIFEYNNNTKGLWYGNVSGSSNSSAYSNYGVYSGFSLVNSTDNTGKWEYVGNIYINYNSTYNASSWNVDLLLKELSNDNTNVPQSSLETVLLTLKGELPAQASATAFNTAVPDFSITLSGNTSLSTNDVAVLVQSTNTSYKYLYVYVKLKHPNTHYSILPQNRYGVSYTSTNTISTSYCYFNYVNGQAVVAALPTPAQGSIVYGTEGRNAGIFSVQTTDATATTLADISTINKFVHIGIRIIATNSANEDIYFQERNVLMKYEAGSSGLVVIHDRLVDSYSDSGLSTLSVSITPYSTNSYKVVVTGIAATTINWKTRIDTVYT